MHKKHIHWYVLAIIVLAIVILPTGTPEDAFTTVPLLGVIGWKKYLVIIGITILVLALTYYLFTGDFKMAWKKYA